MRGGALGFAGLAALVFGFMSFAVKAEDHEVAISEATSSAVTWLALVDDGKYDASWDTASH
jgi:hypothetical protein